MRREEIIKSVKEKLANLNNTFEFSELDMKVYEASTEEFDEKLSIYECPQCRSKYIPENESEVVCPICNKK